MPQEVRMTGKEIREIVGLVTDLRVVDAVEKPQFANETMEEAADTIMMLLDRISKLEAK
jgi:hypothetical protein